MMAMNRTIAIFLSVLILLAGGMAGCVRAIPVPEKQKKLAVLCSTYPMYLFTLQVTAGCENIDVELMLPPGAGCPHDYSLTPGDMRKFAAADVLLLNGAGLDDFLAAPFQKANPHAWVFCTSDGVEDMLVTAACSHEHGHDEDDEDEDDADDEDDNHHHGHGHTLTTNPHLFASPRMAARVVRSIGEGLSCDSNRDSAERDRIRKNAESYAARLDALADEMEAALKGVPNRKIVTEHAVFDYLAKDCGLEIAAVIEENPGQDPVAAQMRALIEQIRASGAAAIFTEPKSLEGPQKPTKVGQTLADELRLPVEVLDPVAIGPDNPPADDYEVRMRKNLATLLRVLDGESATSHKPPATR